MSKKIKRPKRPTINSPRVPRPRTPFEQLTRRVQILEAVVGLNDDAWPLPEDTYAETPLSLVLSELEVTEEELPRFVEWLKANVQNWRNVQE